jgi:uncharacterized protein YggE
MERTVTVVGSASVAVDPDCARLNLGIQVIGSNAQDALRRTNDGMRAIVDALFGVGIDRADVRTGGPRLFPVDKGYAGSNDVSVLVRDVASVGEVIDVVAGAAGPNLTMHGITFSVLDPAVHLSEARAAAMAAAGAIATELATASGAAVGEVLTIDESRGGFPGPMPGLRAMPMAASAGTPVETGTQELRIDVTVTYCLVAPA